MRSFQREAVLVSAVAVASINSTGTATSEGRLSRCFQARIRHRQKGERDYQPGQQILPDRTTLATPLLALSCLIWGGQQWGSG